MTETKADDEIEVTPEMLEAGAEAVHPLDAGLLGPYERAEAIYRAMEAVRRAYGSR